MVRLAMTTKQGLPAVLGLVVSLLLLQLSAARKAPSTPLDAWVGTYEGTCTQYATVDRSGSTSCTQHPISIPVVGSMAKGGVYQYYIPRTMSYWKDGTLEYPEYASPKVTWSLKYKAKSGWLCAGFNINGLSASVLARVSKVDGAYVYEEFGKLFFAPKGNIISECPALVPFTLTCSSSGGFYHYKCTAYRVK